MNLRPLFLVLLLLMAQFARAGDAETLDIPEALQPWVDWVLYDQQDLQCPFVHNDAAQRRCAWPSTLHIDAGDNGAQFTQTWHVFRDSWVQLPGDMRHWPQKVMVDGQAVPVTARQQRPVIQLPAGNHSNEGVLPWVELPDSIKIPFDTALLRLNVRGESVEFPRISNSGELYLEAGRQKAKAQSEKDRIQLKVYRKLEDGIPMNVITRLDLEVSGSAREIELGPVLLADFIPLDLQSRLPTRLESNGMLRVQVRPGRWSVIITSRHPQKLTRLALHDIPAPWPKQEIWVFNAQPQFRTVELEGLKNIDPSQTGLPDSWQALPAYLVSSRDSLALKEVRRGDVTPQPDMLSLRRNMWLDFDGKGYTLEDNINGVIAADWRLSVNPPVELGRVSIDGKDQLITRLDESEQRGVEIRRGQVQLTAESRLPMRESTLPVTHWGRDFQTVHTQLHLPPGWRLLHSRSIDNAPDVGIRAWSLLDVFLVLIVAISVMRLWGLPWGMLALLAMLLTWKEPAAPQYVWLSVLAAVALLRVIPKGRFYRVVQGYWLASLLALVIVAVPFIVSEVREGIYPQLRNTGIAYEFDRGPVVSYQKEAPQSQVLSDSTGKPATEEALSRKFSTALGGESVKPGDTIRRLSEIDPNARVQTGPGLPHWDWQRYNLGWSGPVTAEQDYSLILIPPLINRIIIFAGCGLLLLLLYRMMRTHRKGKLRDDSSSYSVWSLLLPCLFVAQLIPMAHADFPEPAILDELKARLVKAPECAPVCAQIPEMLLNIADERLDLELEVHTNSLVAVPLPGDAKTLFVDNVRVNGDSATSLMRNNRGELWLVLPAGSHAVRVLGRLADVNRFQLILPLRPHRTVAEVNGWSVQGLNKNGNIDQQLEFIRIQDDQPDTGTTLKSTQLPGYARITRSLRLGLEWYVDTVVQRDGLSRSATILEVPLLVGESVLTDGIAVTARKVQVSLTDEQPLVRWRSLLEKRDTLTLTAAETQDWNEVWQIDVSPVWHLETNGIPLTHQHDGSNNWLPEWHPWPGESLTLEVSRPEAVEGKTLTIDKSVLSIKTGERATDSELSLQLRSSLGARHAVTLPEGAELREFSVNGRIQPVQKGNKIDFPVNPGAHDIRIKWREPAGISAVLRTPEISLNAESVNANLNVQLPYDRWVLFAGGPRLGPAVQFWSVLVVILLVSIALGRIQFVPLRSWHWFLLLAGLSQIPVWLSLIVVGWLFALGLRERMQYETLAPAVFNLMQIGLGAITLIALGLLFFAVQQGLLGYPEMQVAGNHSTAYHLKWYQDQSDAVLPAAWVVSVPLMAYRVLMLAWALWLAFALLDWLRWGWQSFSSNGLWRKSRRRTRQPEQPDGELAKDNK